MGLEIGKSLGKVVEVDYKALTADQTHFLQVRVVTPLDKPIHRGGPIVNSEGDKTWIAFRYERLCGLCFKCGKIGHEAKECNVQVTKGEELPYGIWLKAGFRQRAPGNGGLTAAQVGNDPADTPFAPTEVTDDNRVPSNCHDAARGAMDTNLHLATDTSLRFF